MKPLKFLFLLTAGLLIFNSCRDQNDIRNLPPATQTGAQTFGCLIDGKLYKCSGFWDPDQMFDFIGEGSSFYYWPDKVTINAKTKDPESDFSIEFTNNNNSIGTYLDGIEFNGAKTIPDTDSKIIITRFDKTVLSGTFQFTIQYSNGTIRKFTHGRFDIRNE